MGEWLDGIEVWFTALFTAGLVALSFVVAGLVALVAGRWASWRTAALIGVVAGAWCGFMSAGEILKGFRSPHEQLGPVLAFAVVTSLARLRLPGPVARRAGLGVAAVVMAVQAAVTAADLAAIARDPLDLGPRPAEWCVLAAPVPVALVGFVWWLRRKPAAAGGSPPGGV